MANLDAVVLRWAKSELEPVFGPLGTKKAWHRVEERVSKLNQDGKRHGVRFQASFDDGSLTLVARDVEGLAEFRARLDKATGRVQRAFGALILKGAGDGGPKAMAESLALQRQEVLRLAREPLRPFADLAPITDTVFIDPPFRAAHQAKGSTAVGSILAEVSAPGPGSLLIVGPSGVGKSTLVGEAFRRLQAAPAAGWSHPVFVPASSLSFGPTGEVEWERLPGVTAGLGTRLDGLFKEGRLLVFLDGLDENLRLMDLSVPAVWAFWGMASRNRCVITCRDRFYNYRFLCSPVERIFGGTMKTMTLPLWGPHEARALYAAIAERGRSVPRAKTLIEGLDHLSRLTPEVLRDKMASFQVTGLTAWNFALYFALHNGGKFPRNEFEILDYFVDQVLRWEKSKSRDAEPLPIDVLRGLLVRLGRSADGDRNGRKSWRITPETIIEVAGRHYPFLLERKNDLFAALRQIPFLEYEGETGAFHLDYRLGCFFTAKNIVAMGLQDDVERLREECQSPISFQTFVFLLQAFRAFDDESKRRFFATGRKVFEESARLHRLEGGEKHAQCMYEVLEPLGNLDWKPAAEFLAAIARRPGDYPEIVNLSCARAVGYAGDADMVDAYIRRLKRDAAARQVNRNYYLHWLWLGGEYSIEKGRDGMKRLNPEGWERISRWFVQKLTTADFKALRHIQLFTFADLLKQLGPGTLERGVLRDVAEKLKREAGDWSAEARADLADFSRLAVKLEPR